MGRSLYIKKKKKKIAYTIEQFKLIEFNGNSTAYKLLYYMTLCRLFSVFMQFTQYRVHFLTDDHFVCYSVGYINGRFWTSAHAHQMRINQDPV